jgi:hypothetical protein
MCRGRIGIRRMTEAELVIIKIETTSNAMDLPDKEDQEGAKEITEEGAEGSDECVEESGKAGEEDGLDELGYLETWVPLDRRDHSFDHCNHQLGVRRPHSSIFIFLGIFAFSCAGLRLPLLLLMDRTRLLRLLSCGVMS